METLRTKHQNALRATLAFASAMSLSASAVADYPQSYTWYSYDGFVEVESGAGGASDRIYRDVSSSNVTQLFSDSTVVSRSGPLPGGPVEGPSSTQQAYATLQGSADYFALKANTTASASKTVGHYVVSGPGYYLELDNPYIAHSASNASMGWVDRLSIQSDTLPLGEPVDIEVSWSLHAMFGQSGYDVNELPAELLDQFLPSVDLWLSDGLGAHALSLFNDGTEAFIQGSYIIHTTVGEESNVSAGMSVRSPHALAYYPYSGIGNAGSTEFTGMDVSTFADAGNTAYFAIKVLTPNADYVADSGRVYPTSLPVPEPGTWASMLFGLTLLVFFPRKRTN